MKNRRISATPLAASRKLDGPGSGVCVRKSRRSVSLPPRRSFACAVCNWLTVMASSAGSSLPLGRNVLFWRFAHVQKLCRASGTPSAVSTWLFTSAKGVALSTRKWRTFS